MVFSQSPSPTEIEKLRYANSVLKLAIDEKDSFQLAEAYYLFGKLEEAKYDFKKSNEYFLKSLKIQESRGESYQVGRLYLRLYENEFKHGNHPESLKYLRQAYDIFKRNKIEKGLKECNMAMGQFFSASWQSVETGQTIKPNFDSALYYYKKFESTVLIEKNELEVGQIRLLIGIVLLNKNDKKAIPMLEQSMAIHRKFQHGAV